MLLLIVRSVFCSFCFITKVNCCNISNNLKADFIYFNLHLWLTVKGILCWLKNTKSVTVDTLRKTYKTDFVFIVNFDLLITSVTCLTEIVVSWSFLLPFYIILLGFFVLYESLFDWLWSIYLLVCANCSCIVWVWNIVGLYYIIWN